MTAANPSSQLTTSATTAPAQPPSTQETPPNTHLLQLKSQLSLSEKRLAANRANALKSTGPRTSQGKTNSAQNAVKHGLRSQVYFQNRPTKTHRCHEESNHPAECGATYATFQYELERELQPKTILQKTLFPQIVSLAWRLRRLPHTEQEIFARLAPHSEIPNPESHPDSR